ncbi:hypothetical protein [uncultured Dubosiella sp.]|uniref:hypothetical protein n=1 Tax=uncultured Dubosiella sp. TaxID=1937011 RepID=UPI002731150E|nr:hypothetical protein [uncultured Dubosiella sp.]
MAEEHSIEKALAETLRTAFKKGPTDPKDCAIELIRNLREIGNMAAYLQGILSVATPSGIGEDTAAAIRESADECIDLVDRLLELSKSEKNKGKEK